MSNKIMAALSVSLVFWGSAAACSCKWNDERTVRSYAKEMSAIFKGEYQGELSRRVSGFGEVITGKFAVIEVLKGENSSLVLVDYLEDDGMNCGLKFENSVVYEVFARESNGALTTDDCGLTRIADTESGHWSWKRFRKALRK